jgi:hypothetical protein
MSVILELPASTYISIGLVSKTNPEKLDVQSILILAFSIPERLTNKFKVPASVLRLVGEKSSKSAYAPAFQAAITFMN